MEVLKRGQGQRRYNRGGGLYNEVTVPRDANGRGREKPLQNLKQFNYHHGPEVGAQDVVLIYASNVME